MGLNDFSTKNLNRSDKLAYFAATRGIEITSAIHNGALALVLAGLNGYRVSHTSKSIELEGIKLILAHGNARESLFSGAVRYNIIY